MSFADLPAPLRDALAARGYAEPTAVQSAVLTPDAAGRDLLVSAQTGSGKTVAYGLALAPELIGDAPRLPPAGAPLALVVAPTRELALQVKAELTWLYAPAGGRIVSCVGGMDPVAERRQLAQGAHIVVGTPGRLRDHLERGNLAPASLRAVVLDEADEMLDLGFKEELEAILEETPAERRTLLFSATVPRGIAALAKGYQRDALRIEATSQAEPHGDIEYRAALVAPHEIERAVVNVLRLEDARIAMVFCATRATVARLHGNLAERGFSTVALSGELSQAERNRALQNLRDGRARVCVATDVAARGIDLPDLGLVIHAELPRDPETLLHRSGRTGRAGRKGVSVLLVPHTRRRLGERLIAAARVKAGWAPAPSVELVRGRDDQRLGEQARSLMTEEGSEDDLALARQLLAEAAPAPEAAVAALLRVLRAPLPAPEELTEITDRAPARDAAPRREAAPAGGQEGVWFRMDVGRDGRADPKWLLPFLCRRGHVTRQEIGRIRILARETQFEVAPYAATRFASAVRRSGSEDEHIHIVPMQPVKGPPRKPRARQ
ncbi:DEAD/DEAH box helicase [Roseomonas terrae]|jgi:ATP-dependent RNA helicase DeaD|uniref:DEAD/DEAH box helicase n=2 Tax=Neoroseomonas terrae TaxID=424799 RepID=A0ABS5EE03_9PROT|nr:DEAD/DEAH box helicase [Neoroseomonas terrae]MBR0648942.1 DEAD/DEAH box helicase [Neoroseomonas terrae]